MQRIFQKLKANFEGAQLKVAATDSTAKSKDARLNRKSRRPLQRQTLKARRAPIIEGARLEFDDYSGLGAEIVLGAVADYGGIAEASANPRNVYGAEGDVFAERDVEAAPENEVEGIVVRQFAEVETFALGGAAIEDIRVDIVVSSAEHKLRKRQHALEVKAQDLP